MPGNNNKNRALTVKRSRRNNATARNGANRNGAAARNAAAANYIEATRKAAHNAAAARNAANNALPKWMRNMISRRSKYPNHPRLPNNQEAERTISRKVNNIGLKAMHRIARQQENARLAALDFGFKPPRLMNEIIGNYPPPTFTRGVRYNS